MRSTLHAAMHMKPRARLASGAASAIRIAACIAALSLAACRSDPTAAGPGGVRECWYQPQTGTPRARPAVSGNTVYFGTGAGEIIARDVATGARRWTAKVGVDRVDGAAIVLQGGVLVAPLVRSTAGLDAGSGKLLWTYYAPQDTVGGPTGPGSVVLSSVDSDGETVYIPAWGASVSAVDLRSGAAKWVWQPGRSPTDTAASGVFRSGSMGVKVSGDTVYAVVWHNTTRLAYTENWVVALDRRTGRELWRVTLPRTLGGALISSAPVVWGNLVIVHEVSAETYAIDRSTQQIVWKFITPGEVGDGTKRSTNAGAALYGDAVYVDGGEGNMYALRAADGRVIWKGAIPNTTSSELLVTERRIIFSTGAIMVLDRLTGRQIAAAEQPRTSDPLISSAAAYADGRVFVTVANAAWCFYEP